MTTEAGLTVGQLAERAGMTVRNVRAHASRGLLPPPRMRGRTGLYGTEHLTRLELITRLQDEGFSLAAIERLLTATPSRSAEDALAQYLEMLMSWRQETPVDVQLRELGGWLGTPPTPATLATLVESGLIEHLDQGTVRILSPAMLRTGVEAQRLGLPLEALLGVRRRLVEQSDRIAEDFIELFRSSVWRPFVDAGMPDEQFSDVRRMVAELPPIAAAALIAAFREAMPRAVAQFVVEASSALDAVRDGDGSTTLGEGDESST